MQKFCHHCGKPTIVGSKFCPNCGTNLTSLSSTPTPPVQSAQFTPLVVSDDEDGEGYIDSPNHLAKIKNLRITALDVELGVGPQVGEKFGAMIAQAQLNGGPIQTVIEPRGQPYKDIDQKAFLAEFSKEAGAGARPKE